MAIKLTEGALEIIMTGGDVDEPVMQILGSKKIQGNGANDRYRLLISDGKHSHSFAMLATQLNQRLIDGELSDFTVIKIVRFITSVLNNTGKGEKVQVINRKKEPHALRVMRIRASRMRVMIILDVQVLTPGKDLGMKIGNPQTWLEGSTPAPSTSAPPPRLAPAPSTNRNLMDTSASSSVSNGGSQLHQSMTHPIAGLSPYQNKWVIKARVMSKSSIRSWSNSKGEGKLFSMDLCDESGEIRATAFKDQCDKFYDMIEIDKVYFISRCTLKTANKQYTTLKNDYEMSFTPDTVVEECTDTVDSIPSMQYNFIPISELATKEPDAAVDVIGVCKTTSDITELVARSSGRQLKKREITLVDKSGSAVALTLWGTEAETFDGSQLPVVAVRGAHITEYNGSKSLATRGGTVIRINPDVSEAHQLRGWFDNEGCQMDAVNMSARVGGGSGGGGSSDWLTFSDAEERQMGSGEKGDYYNLLGVLSYISSDNALYQACPQEACNKKVVDQENGLYRCEKCNREYPNFKYRIIMSGYISDFSGEQWVTIFNEQAEAILGQKVEDIGRALETDKKAYQAMFEDITFKTLVFRIRTKMENYSDETRLKSTIMTAQPVDYKDANSRIIKQIKAATGIQLS